MPEQDSPRWTIRWNIIQPLLDWWGVQCFAFQAYSALRKLPYAVALMELFNDHQGHWVAVGFHRSTGTSVRGEAASVYVAIRRMQREAEDEAAGIDLRTDVK